MTGAACCFDGDPFCHRRWPSFPRVDGFYVVRYRFFIVPLQFMDSGDAGSPDGEWALRGREDGGHGAAKLCRFRT